VLTPARDRKERIGRILQMHANHREEPRRVYTGDIVAVVGLKSTTTVTPFAGCAPDRARVTRVPEPVVHVAVEPKTKADQDKLSRALFALSEEDPTFRVRSDQETGQTVISGMGELHLEVLVDRMLREFKVDAKRRQAAGRLPRDHPRLGSQDRGALHPPDRRPWPVRPRGDRPRADGTGRRIRIRRQGHRWSDTEGVHPCGRRGIQEAMNSGVLAGFPIVDVRVTLVYGSYHDVDSSEMAFKIAGSMAFKKAVRAAHPYFSSRSWR